MHRLENFIDGQFQSPCSDQWLENRDPSTHRIISMVADSCQDDLNKAMTSAQNAFSTWSRLCRKERGHYLEQIANGIEARLDEFAMAESLDQGKPLWLAKSVDIPRSIENFRFFASAILHEEDACFHKDQGSVHMVKRQPIGIAGLISPWNLPLYLLTWKIAPALACGNCVIAKPSEFTSTTATMLAEVMQSISLPKGVCNILLGRGEVIGEAIASSPFIPLISFTGSTKTGELIAKSASPFHKKLSLELGGKNPALIFSDCDLAKAVETTVRSSFTNQGEICLCTSRIYVEDTIFERFATEFVKAIEALKIGDPRDENTFFGPLVSHQHLSKVRSMTEAAFEEGLQCLYQGNLQHLKNEQKEGYYFPPHVFINQDQSLAIMQEEIFGPVVVLCPFKNFEEAITLANQSRYGLAATVWSQNISTCQKAADALESGLIWINGWMDRDLRIPFGGQKQSGYGREGGRYSLDFYSETKSICINY